MAAKIVKCSVIVTVLLILSVAVAQDNYDVDQWQMLFETALVNDRYALRQLQQIFYSSDSKQSPEKVCLSVSVRVDTTASLDYCFYPAFVCDDFSGCHFDSYYELQQQIAYDASDTSELAKLMTKSGSTSVFYAMDPSFYSIMKTLSNFIALSLPSVYIFDNVEDHIRIDIAIHTALDKMPCWDDAVFALRSVLMWAKFYARTNINETKQSKEESDRSSVSDGMRFRDYHTEQCQSRAGNVLTQPHNTWALVLGIFYFSNLLLIASTLLNFRKVFLWLQGQNKLINTSYKASAAVLTCVNIVALISDLYIIVSDGIHSVDSDQFKLFNIILWVLVPVKVPLVVLVLILETPVACFNTHLQNDANQPNTRCQRFAHAFALCQIIWFVHRLINDTVISVIFFVLAPAQTLGVVTLILSTIVSATAFVAILIYNFKGCNKKTCTLMTCVTMNGLIICGLLLAITLLFIVLVDNGLKSAGMGGLILSLIPPLAVFIIGLIINQKYFKSKGPPTTVTATPEPGEPNQPTAIQMPDDDEEEGVPLLLQVRARP